jgi:hypothetical protein
LNRRVFFDCVSFGRISVKVPVLEAGNENDDE